jgi:hypothetical protein
MRGRDVVATVVDELASDPCRFLCPRGTGCDECDLAWASVTPVILGLVWLVVAALIVRRVFTRRGRSTIGTGAAGAYYDMLSKDQREAIHVLVEKRAEKQDPETRDGTLPGK